MKLTLHNPLKPNLVTTQGFGENPTMYADPKYGGIKGHNGIDYWASDGTPVYATHDGRVTFAGYDGAGGLGVVIRTNEEFEYGDGVSYFKTIYWHLKKDSLLVTGGQQVVRGQQIGGADNTGASTGSHLHFGLKPYAKGENDWTWYNVEQSNGYNGAVDPLPYFVKFQNEIKIGDRGYDVRDLQEFLKKLGYFKVEPTAYYGAFTARAVLDFQKANGVLSWGDRFLLGTRVGPKTLAKLNELYR